MLQSAPQLGGPRGLYVQDKATCLHYFFWAVFSLTVRRLSSCQLARSEGSQDAFHPTDHQENVEKACQTDGQYWSFCCQSGPWSCMPCAEQDEVEKDQFGFPTSLPQSSGQACPPAIKSVTRPEPQAILVAFAFLPRLAASSGIQTSC